MQAHAVDWSARLTTSFSADGREAGIPARERGVRGGWGSTSSAIPVSSPASGPELIERLERAKQTLRDKRIRGFEE
ncbi:hypothetical protein CCZ27_09310 [Thauera sinica]|nr:hypothetical protein CCZ27_09310 [Thauera sp. K11]